VRVAPVVIVGWDDEANYWAASRDGEPTLTGVQSLGDAYMASASREADLVISEAVYSEMVASGDAPPQRPTWAKLPDS
jgi:hypothetical protein